MNAVAASKAKLAKIDASLYGNLEKVTQNERELGVPTFLILPSQPKEKKSLPKF